jgi:hypothetical protein
LTLLCKVGGISKEPGELGVRGISGGDLRRGRQGGAAKAYDGGCGGWEIETWEATAAVGCKEGGRGMGDWDLGGNSWLQGGMEMEF